MRLAFHAPLKPPDHPVPSGDRRMARALIDALGRGGHQVDLASRLRSYDRAGDDRRQARLEGIGGRLAARLIRRYRRPTTAGCPSPGWPRPDAWLTYHAYHKSPDWLGPAVSAALAIPYLLVEASFAPKQAGGPWARGHQASARAIGQADLVLAMTERDVGCLAPLVRPPAELRRLPPFVDPEPQRRALAERARHRAALAARHGLDPTQPWLITVAMMRADVKRDSYRVLADALGRLGPRAWQLLVIGHGPAQAEIRDALTTVAGDRVVFDHQVMAEAELAGCLAAADLFVWPALCEAYGLAMLEAQAAGLAVVAGRDGGVAEVVRDGETGLLTPPGDPIALAEAVAQLLDRPERRLAMAGAALGFVARDRSIDAAVTTLSDALDAAVAIRTRRR